MANILMAWKWGVDACDNPKVMYSNNYRNQKTVDGITYYDCSSFIWYALMVGEFDVIKAYKEATGTIYAGNAITTYYESKFLKYLGFVAMSPGIEWEAGDIMWREGHTEMVYDISSTMGARSSRLQPIDQVSIHATGPNDWSILYRYMPKESGVLTPKRGIF